MITISEIMFYGRYYSDEMFTYDISWWLCLKDYKVYHTETLMTDYSYENISEIKKSLSFIPLFKTDIIQLEKEFVERLNNKTFNKNLDKILVDNNCSYDVAFKIFIEKEFMVDSWSEYEKSNLVKDAIAWCRDNYLPYKMQKEKKTGDGSGGKTGDGKTGDGSVS